MTELEKLKIVRSYLVESVVKLDVPSIEIYQGVVSRIAEINHEGDHEYLAMKDRAERAEKAVSDLQVLKHTVEMEKQSAHLREHAEKERAERAEAALKKVTAERDELHIELAEWKRDDCRGYRKRIVQVEAALSEAQDRALRFEKMLKAEEARKDGEIVLEKSRVLTTARNILTMDEKFRYVSTVAFWALVAYLENNGDNAEPYRCQ